MKLYLNPSSFIDTNEPLDISLPLSDDGDNPIAWYVEPPVFAPVRTEHYTGSVAEGGTVNFRNIYFNPHGHGTHTECLGHITEEVYSVNDALKTFFFRAQVVTINPKKVQHDDGELDRVITRDQLQIQEGVEALIIRTLPNIEAKKHMNYSNSNPPYIDVDVVSLLNEKNIKHLLVDMPSVDRENDEGKLIFHHSFWGVPENYNFERTITELIFIEDSVLDGLYILNLQVAPFKNDASPSRPVLYTIKEDV